MRAFGNLRLARSVFSLALALVLLLAAGTGAQASSAQAANITARCSFSPSSNASSFRLAVDGRTDTVWKSGWAASRTVDIKLPSGARAGGVYLVWNVAPASWELYARERGGKQTLVASFPQRYLTQYARIPAGYAGCGEFRLVMKSSGLSTVAEIAELAVFGPGGTPIHAPEWKPFGGRADLLTIATHPDDEALYLSVPAVTYANQGKVCQTVFMTYGNTLSRRRFEAQESVWSLGNASYPEMGSFLDVKRSPMEAMAQVWGMDAAVGYLVEMIRKYKPSVVVTHDAAGEYGHCAHKLTQYAAAQAFRRAGDPASYPESAVRYGIWRAGKLYVHLYRGCPLNPMPLAVPMQRFGGRSTLQVIRDAYSRHKSQLPGRALPVEGPYDMKRFGLYLSNLGQDRLHATMFEHVSQQTMLALNPWYSVCSVDRRALKQALQDAGRLSEPDYPPELWAEAGLPAALAGGRRVMEDPTSSQGQVDAATGALRRAMGILSSVAAGGGEPVVTYAQP